MLNLLSLELLRYIINGLLATIVHFGCLKVSIEILAFPSAAIANIMAASVGITVSFLGSRYFVFRRTEPAIGKQALKFSLLYGSIAALHGLVLLIWTDFLNHDYRVGFLIATAFQVLISYYGNKFLVFKKI